MKIMAHLSPRLQETPPPFSLVAVHLLNVTAFRVSFAASVSSALTAPPLCAEQSVKVTEVREKEEEEESFRCIAPPFAAEHDVKVVGDVEVPLICSEAPELLRSAEITPPFKGSSGSVREKLANVQLVMVTEGEPEAEMTDEEVSS